MATMKRSHKNDNVPSLPASRKRLCEYVFLSTYRRSTKTFSVKDDMRAADTKIADIDQVIRDLRKERKLAVTA